MTVLFVVSHTRELEALDGPNFQPILAAMLKVA